MSERCTCNLFACVSLPSVLYYLLASEKTHTAKNASTLPWSHTHTHTHTQTNTHTHTHTDKHTYTHTHTQVLAHTHILSVSHPHT